MSSVATDQGSDDASELSSGVPQCALSGRPVQLPPSLEPVTEKNLWSMMRYLSDPTQIGDQAPDAQCQLIEELLRLSITSDKAFEERLNESPKPEDFARWMFTVPKTKEMLESIQSITKDEQFVAAAARRAEFSRALFGYEKSLLLYESLLPLTQASNEKTRKNALTSSVEALRMMSPRAAGHMRDLSPVHGLDYSQWTWRAPITEDGENDTGASAPSERNPGIPAEIYESLDRIKNCVRDLAKAVASTDDPDNPSRAESWGEDRWTELINANKALSSSHFEYLRSQEGGTGGRAESVSRQA